MKILVCVSKTPETTAKIAFTDDNTKFNNDGIQYIMNPYDEWYALVKALEIKESLGQGEVVTLSVGLTDYDPIIRKGLAIGADRAVRYDIEATNGFQVATQIADYAKAENFDAIFLGKETIDYNGAEVGAMVAELLDLPYISFASHIDIQDGKLVITRDIEGGVEIAQVEGPFVLSAAKGLAEQRIPNMRGIMTAKRKPLEVKTAVQVPDRIQTISFSLPSEKSGVKMVDPENMDELVRLLHEEAKVI